MKRRQRSGSASMPATGMRVRFAPSPTGDLHLGSAMVAIANRALVGQGNGAFVLRIDDTDAARSTGDSADAVLATLAWLELQYDEGPVHQASLERAARHAAVVGDLLEADKAYPCFCLQERLDELAADQRAAGQAPRYDGHCALLTAAEASQRRAAGDRPAIRLRVDPARDWSFDDLVHGRVAAPGGSFGDFVVARSDGSATYLLASAVDDADLDITHVVRGADHLANTPRQLALFAAFGVDPPEFAHLPLLLGEHGSKLAKRDATGSVAALRAAGVTAGAVRALCWELLGQATGAEARDPFGAGDAGVGWAPLDLGKVPRSSPQVARARLASLGTSTIASWPIATLRAAVAADLVRAAAVPRDVAAIGDPARLDGLIEDLRGGAESPRAIAQSLIEMLAAPEAPHGAPLLPPPLRDLLGDADLDTPEGAAQAMQDARAMAKANGWKLGTVLRPLRLVLTGQEHGPHLDAVLHALGSDAVRQRLELAATH